jgi:hypothetical protein
MAPGLKAAPEETVEPAEFVARAAGVEASVEAERRARVEAIFGKKRGSVFLFASGERRAVQEMESAEKLWEAMRAGACWTDDGVEGAASRWATEAGAGRTAATITPLATKLYQESGLWRRAGRLGKES